MHTSQVLVNRRARGLKCLRDRHCSYGLGAHSRLSYRPENHGTFSLRWELPELGTSKTKQFCRVVLGAPIAHWFTPVNCLGRNAMNRHLLHGMVVGTIFTALITWVAASDTFAEGGYALLASVVFGLAAGLCIGGLVAANFAMLTVEKQEHKASESAHATGEIRAAA
jgi:hypothetical protein